MASQTTEGAQPPTSPRKGQAGEPAAPGTPPAPDAPPEPEPWLDPGAPPELNDAPAAATAPAASPPETRPPGLELPEPELSARELPGPAAPGPELSGSELSGPETPEPQQYGPDQYEPGQYDGPGQYKQEQYKQEQYGSGQYEPQQYAQGQYEQQQYRDGYAEQLPVSKLAVITLVTGLLALVPITVLCGIASFTGRRRTTRRGHGMAVAGLFAAGTWVVLGGAAGTLAVITHGFHRDVHVHYKQDAIFNLREGNCLDNGPNGQAFTIQSCSVPHDSEVFATFALPGTAWPGAARVSKLASTGCVGRLNSYMNPDLATAGLTQVYMYPDQTAWAAGVRSVVCEVRSTNGKITGSVRKAS